MGLRILRGPIRLPLQVLRVPATTRSAAAWEELPDSKIARPDSNDSQAGTMIFARKIFFPDSFCPLRPRQVQLGPRVAALHLSNAPCPDGPAARQFAASPLARRDSLIQYLVVGLRG